MAIGSLVVSLLPNWMQPLPPMLLLLEWFPDWLLLICINHSRIEVGGSLAQNKVKSETHIFTAKDTEDRKKSHFSVFLVEDKTLPFFLEISPNQEGVRDWVAASEKCLLNILKVFMCIVK